MQLSKYLAAIKEEEYADGKNILAKLDYLCIRPLSSRLFSLPATSAPVERVFSHGGLRWERDALLEMIMFLAEL